MTPASSADTGNTEQLDSVSRQGRANQSMPEDAPETGSCDANKQGGSTRLRASVGLLRRISPWPDSILKGDQESKRQGYFDQTARAAEARRFV